MESEIVKNFEIDRKKVYSLIVYAREQREQNNVINGMDIAIEIFSGSDFDEWLVTDSEKEYYRNAKSFQDLCDKILEFVAQERDMV